MNNIQKRALELLDEMVEIRRDFHRNPELSAQEFRTAEKIENYLDGLDIEHFRAAETGVVGLIQGKREKGSGKVIGIRADIDALRIQEAEDREYHSLNDGVMHACGHDVHAAILLGAARMLKEKENEFCGTVKLFFQPAEEAVGGAKRMIAGGVLENPDVDHVIGLHVQPDIETGKAQLKYGTLTAITDKILMTVKGKSGHAAVPEKAIDPIVITAQIISAFQLIVSRSVGPLDSAVLTIGSIHGGTQANIIAEEVTMEGTLRTFNMETRAKAEQQMKDISASIAESFGGSIDYELREGYIGVVNDRFVTDIIKDTAVSQLGEENVEFREHPGLGGEDFAYFAEAVPSSFYNLGCGNKEKGITASPHNMYFDVDEECMPIGAALQVESVLKLLKS